MAAHAGASFSGGIYLLQAWYHGMADFKSLVIYSRLRSHNLTTLGLCWQVLGRKLQCLLLAFAELLTR